MGHVGMIYRPPSEARSFLLQVTVGCSHNTCTFCTMYKDKQFYIKDKKEIFADVDEMAERYANYEMRVFLCDGDALVLPTEFLLEIINYVKEKLPYASRITSYATAADILRKSDEDLKALREAGLEMVYVGAESGSQQILNNIHKDVTVDEIVAASEKLKRANIQLSLTLISGLGGVELLEEHALESAKLVTRAKPDYLGFLTLMLEPAAEIMKDINEGRLTLLKPRDVVEEMKIFLTNVDSEGTVFRANHASNYLILKGTLNRDIERMMAEIRRAEELNRFRDESYRSL